MTAARAEDRGRLRVLREARRPVLLLPRPRRRPGGPDLRRDPGRTSTRWSTTPAAHQERTGIRLLWGTANLFSHPRYAAGAATNPDPGGVRLRRRAGQGACSRPPTGSAARTTCCGAGARATRRCSTPTSPARSAQLARFLHLVAEHKHRIGFKGHAPHRAEAAWSRPSTSTTTTPRPSTASSPGTGSRGSTGVNLEVEPRDARRPQLPPRGRLRDLARDLRQHRREPRRLPERLGHRPVPELGRRAVARGLRDPPARRVHDRRVQLRRQAAPPEHRPDRPVPRPHRRDRHARPVAAGRGRHDRARGDSSSCARQRYAGWVGRARPVDPGRRCPARGARRRASRPARSIRSRRRVSRSALENDRQPVGSGPRTERRRGSRPAPVADPGGPRPRDRRLDDRDEGGPDRRDRDGPRRRRVRVRVRASRTRSGASRSRRLWWDGAVDGDPVGPGVDRRGRRRRRRRRADRPDARRRPARRGRRRPPPGDPVERPADGAPSATRSAVRSAPSGSSRSPATTP